MANIRVPSFLTKLDKLEKEEMMKQYASWKKWGVVDYLTKHLEAEIERLIKEDENKEPSSEFQYMWEQSGRLAQRKLLRHILKDFS